MKSFKDLGIKSSKTMFVGDKIKISRVMNRSLVITCFEVRPSKYPEKSENALVLQVEFEDEPRIIFTGSRILIDQIKQVKKEDFPFLATIVKNGEHFEFR